MMYRGFKITVVTPAGRRQYLEILLSYILSNVIIDEYQLWINTDNKSDIKYIKNAAVSYKKIVIVEPVGEVSTDIRFRGRTINQFFKNCQDEETIYIRFDDDIVYIDDNLIERLIDARLEFRDPFLVFPLILNNPVCSLKLAIENKIEFILSKRSHLRATAMNYFSIYWNSAEFAEHLHRYVLSLLVDDKLDVLRTKQPVLASLCRVSINCFAWFGSDLASVGGVPDGVDEEEYLSVTVPVRTRRPNIILGDVSVVHYAYFPQRDRLDLTDILAQYKSLALSKFSDLYQLNVNLTYSRESGFRDPAGIGALVVGDAELYFGDRFESRRIRFNPDGSIFSGPSGGHENESYWVYDRDELQLIHSDKKTITSRLKFVRDRLDNQPIAFQGMFLGAPNYTNSMKGNLHTVVIYR